MQWEKHLKHVYVLGQKTASQQHISAGQCVCVCAVPSGLQSASRKLDEDRAQLEEWGARLAALTKEFDEAKQEVKAARTEIQEQRGSLASQAAALCAAQEQQEIQRQAILDARLDMDRCAAAASVRGDI
jgi:septal ring factor EnvC (AmiA/AmiB activator)